MNIFHKKSIGLDISDHTIEAVELIKSGGKIKIVNMGRIELDPGVVEQGRIKNEEKLNKAIKKVFNNAKPGHIVDKNIIFGLPESQVFTHIFTINSKSLSAGALNKELIEELTLKEARESIPMEIGEALFSYKILHRIKNEAEILLIAARKKTVLEWQKFFKKAKKDVEIFDIEILSSYRGLFKNTKDPICLIDIGAATTNIAIFNKTGLCYAYAINSAGDVITQEIAKILKIKTDEAEILKIKTGVADTKSLIFPVVIKFLEQILKEIQTALRYFENNSGQSVKEIVFIGGSSKLRGLIDYFQANFDLPVRIGQSELITEKIPLEYIGAIGMALKGLDKKWLQKDPFFSVSDIKEKKKLIKKDTNEELKLTIDNSEDSSLLQFDAETQNNKLRSKKIVLGVVLIVGLIFITLAFLFRHNNKIKRETQLEFQIEQSLAPVEQATDIPEEDDILEEDDIPEGDDINDILIDNKENIETEKPIFTEVTEGEETEESDEFAPYVIIKETETGWLNVRQGPSVSYEIISKINPGEEYQILEEEDNWIKIQLPGDLEGWIFNRYADKYID